MVDYEIQVSAEDVLDRWEKKAKMIQSLNPDKHNALIEKVVNHCKENEWTASQTKNACDFVRELSGEMVVSFFNSVMETNHVPNIRSVHKLIGMLVVDTVNASNKV